MRVKILERTSGTLERMLSELKGLSKAFRNPNTSLKDLLKINNYYFHSDPKVEKAIYFVNKFYENKIRDDKKSKFLNQHLGDVTKNTLIDTLDNYKWSIEKRINTFIASLNHDFVEHFPDKAYLLKEEFGEDVYNLVLAVTMPSNEDINKNQFIDKIDNLSDERPKIIKIEDYDNNIRSSTNLLLTLTYSLIQNKVKREKNAYKKNIEFYDKYRPKIIRYTNYLDNYTKITRTLPGNLDRKIKKDVNILKRYDNIFYKILKGDYLHLKFLSEVKIPNLYPRLDKLVLKGR